jgi:hypothetical protein
LLAQLLSATASKDIFLGKNHDFKKFTIFVQIRILRVGFKIEKKKKSTLINKIDVLNIVSRAK